MALIYNAAQFAKKLHKLKKAGGKAEDAANQAWTIIANVASREQLSARTRSKLTPRGEARIEGCRKFDLGGGYRLLYVKKSGKRVFLFVGAHDECDTWVKNHSGAMLDIDQAEPVSGLGKEPDQTESGSAEELQELPRDDDKLLHEVLDQKTLREIFCGIGQKPR